jgi:hypothetical protein
MAPKPTFEQWVRAFGIRAVAELCGVTERTVYHWIAGHSKPSHVNCIIIMTRCRHLTLADIVGGVK